MKGGSSSLKRRIVFFGVILFCLIISTGCVTKEAVKSVSDENVLKERAMAYWNLRINREFDKTYEYEYNPDNLLNKGKYVELISRGAVEYKGYDSLAVEKKEDSAAELSLDMKVAVKFSGKRTFEHSMIIKDKWVKGHGVWYHFIGI